MTKYVSIFGRIQCSSVKPFSKAKSWSIALSANRPDQCGENHADRIISDASSTKSSWVIVPQNAMFSEATTEPVEK